MMSEKTLGILGGMGSYATVDLFKKILESTPTQTDQDHIHIIIDNNSKIPNRRKYILGESDLDPTPFLQATAQNLQSAGADFLILGCNGAHFFLQKIQESVDIPVMSIIDETVKYVATFPREISTIGLFASVSTLKAGLYHRAFAKNSIQVLTPSQEVQQEVMKIVDKVKAGNLNKSDKKEMRNMAENLILEGSDAILMACTEVPIVLGKESFSVPLFDATDILAKSVVAKIKGIPLSETMI